MMPCKMRSFSAQSSSLIEGLRHSRSRFASRGAKAAFSVATIDASFLGSFTASAYRRRRSAPHDDFRASMAREYTRRRAPASFIVF